MFEIIKKYNLQIILVLSVLILYTPSLKNDFLTNWDDESYVVRNADIQSFNISNIQKVFSSYYVGHYHPITMLSYMFDASIDGLNPKVFHTTNMLLHIINVLLVFALVLLLLKNRFSAFLAALLFGIHPMHVESVAWISGRKDVLYTLFFIASLIVYVKYVSLNSYRTLIICFVFFILSVLSKSMAMTLPGILIIIDSFLGRKFSWKIIIEKIPFLIVSIIIAYIAVKSQSEQAMSIAPHLSIINRFLMVFYSIAYYLFMFIFPFHFAAIQYYPSSIVAGETSFIFYLIPFALLLLLLFLFNKKATRVLTFFSVSFFVISLSVVLQFVPVGMAVVAERYTYIPYIGLSLPLIFFIHSTISNKAKKHYLVYFLLLGFVLYFGIATSKRVKQWKNSIILFSDLCTKYPDNSHAWWSLANSQKEYTFYADAIQSYNTCIKLNPNYDMAYFNRGIAKVMLKDYKGGWADYNKTLLLNPNYTGVMINKGNILFEKKDYKEAINEYEKAIELDEKHTLAHLQIGLALSETEQLGAAIQKFTHVIDINPMYADAYYYRGVIYYNRNHKDSACIDWKQASILNHIKAKELLKNYCK